MRNNLGLYQEILMDHYNNPRGSDSIDNPTFTSKEYNPACGDSVQVQAIIMDDQISDIAFQGKGCIISQAVASVVMEKSLNAPLTTILVWDKTTILDWINQELGPNRLKCALMALEALQHGIRQNAEG